MWIVLPSTTGDQLRFGTGNVIVPKGLDPALNQSLLVHPLMSKLDRRSNPLAHQRIEKKEFDKNWV